MAPRSHHRDKSFNNLLVSVAAQTHVQGRLVTFIKPVGSDNETDSDTTGWVRAYLPQSHIRCSVSAGSLPT